MTHLRSVVAQLILAAGIAGSALAGMEYNIDGVNYTSADRIGGSGGDHQENSNCPSGTVAVGVQVADNDTYVTGIALVCASIDRIGFWTTTHLGDFVGQSSTHRTNRLCASGRVLSGFEGREGWYVDAITVRCSTVIANLSTNLATRGGIATSGSLVGGPGGTVDNVSCPADNTFIWYLEVHWGWYIDSVTGHCRGLRINDTIPNRAAIQLAVRTVGQESILALNGSDSFSVDVFNFGSQTAAAGAVKVTLQTSSGDAKIDVSSASVACTLNQPATLAVCHIPSSITTDHVRSITGLGYRRVGTPGSNPSPMVSVKAEMDPAPAGVVLSDTAQFPVFLH